MKVFFISLLFLFPFIAGAQSVGFVDSAIWFSKENLTEGETVKVYTAVFNGGAHSLSGSVEFYDKTVLLGKRDFKAPADTTATVSIDWKVTAGDHTITAKIVNASYDNSGREEPATLSLATAPPQQAFVPKQITVSPAETKEAVVNKLEQLEDNVISVVPPEVAEPIGGAISGIETFRKSTLEKVTEEKEETKKALSAPKKEEGQGSSVDGPLKQIKLFFLNVIGFILGSAVVFFILLALVAFLILRFIWRRIF